MPQRDQQSSTQLDGGDTQEDPTQTRRRRARHVGGAETGERVGGSQQYGGQGIPRPRPSDGELSH